MCSDCLTLYLNEPLAGSSVGVAVGVDDPANEGANHNQQHEHGKQDANVEPTRPIMQAGERITFANIYVLQRETTTA